LKQAVRFLAAVTSVLWASTLLTACATPFDREGAADGATTPAAMALDCPLSTNCVNSLGPDGLAPLRYAGPSERGKAALLATLALFPEATVLHSTDLSVDAIFTTPMGFVEEVTFRLPPHTQRIDFRSRSKIGLYDFNSNRSRMTAFSAQFAAQTGR
jgi:uncharacterized protein (DUF1499 family)